jgi:ribonuclease E
MSAPEMPAKEVSPEFGFRDASPSVAAAALAAIKGGGSGNGRRSRNGGSDRRGAAPSEEPPGERVATPTATETIAEASEETHRRRRRRGGRGRGRSRHEDSAPAAAGSEEIGWEELDDLSQLDGVEEEREYTFEDADAATLAELGISPDEVAVEAPAEGEKPKRRTRAKKADTANAEEPKPKRTRAKKADAADGEDKPKRSRTTKADVADGDEKPRRRTRTSASDSKNQASAAAADGADGGEPQGIWGRFRSARKPRATTSSCPVVGSVRCWAHRPVPGRAPSGAIAPWTLGVPYPDTRRAGPSRAGSRHSRSRRSARGPRRRTRR